MSNTELEALIASKLPTFRKGDIVNGTILEIRPQVVLVDIGYKSEGVIPISEFEDEDIEVGDQIEVLLESLENDEGHVVLSKEKAAHKQNWDKIVAVFKEGGLVKGKVKSVVKGGLMVNVGVEAFLPGSQVDIIPPKDLNEFVGNVYEFKIVKVNDERKNIVLSRREVIEAERSEQRQRFLETVNAGDKVRGIVKNLILLLSRGSCLAARLCVVLWQPFVIYVLVNSVRFSSHSLFCLPLSRRSIMR